MNWDAIGAIGEVIDEYLFSFWSVFRRVEEDAYEDGDWHAHVAHLQDVLRRPGVAKWWSQRKIVFPPKFVEELVKHGEPAHRRQR